MPHIDVFRRDIVNRGTTGILIYTQVDDHDINMRARMFALAVAGLGPRRARQFLRCVNLVRSPTMTARAA
jgi:hypothetical protein